MAKVRSVYVCSACGTEASKWGGKCADCGEWNTIAEQQRAVVSKAIGRAVGYAGPAAPVRVLAAIATEDAPRIATGLSELDRVLGGGLVTGSVVLIGGDPGIGKSTILLQTLTHLAQTLPALYITGEESLSQVAMRGRRLELPLDKLRVMAETQVETIIATAEQERPRILVVD